ncbi:MAG: N-acetylmuramoyl-L-alanine amidase family protein, partial [Flavobacteriales bacterium]
MMYAQLTVKRSFLLFLALAVIPFLGMTQNAEEPFRIKTIVIDAGHGGKDPGNLGTGRYKAKEKDIALEVALRVGEYIGKQFPDINVIYTRKTDVFIGLDGRAEIANDAKADLFLSIHCNAFPNPNSNGVETFVLGLHRNKENLQVAMKENSAIFLEEDYKTRYEGFDPNSAESIIALTIMQSAYLQQSLAISSYIQSQFKNRVGRRDRGVKQAGFLVLRKTTMPSILTELGFLTNKEEEDFLNSENGKV